MVGGRHARHLFLTAATAFGIHAHRIREDRLLYEAAVTADPVHLIRVFGVSVGTAMRYVNAAHPERAAVPPSR
ncbi:hypothetical protein ABZ907_45560 [Nonomuraea wenchangensis]